MNTQAATVTKSAAPVVRLERTIPASPDSVYRAWLEPAQISRWMKPSSPVERVDIDERVGGHYRVWTGDGGGFDCELVELVPGAKIVMRWGFVGPERRQGPTFDSLLTVTLRPVAGGTLLNLVHEQLDEFVRAMPDIAQKVESAWRAALDTLAQSLAKSPQQ